MITIKLTEEIKLMRRGGRILAETLQRVSEKVRPGVSAYELDKLARELVFSRNARPSFLNYNPDGDNPYPAALCVSINNEVVHGIPTKDKIIREGDLVKLDLGVDYKKLFTDAAVMVGVGKLSPMAEKILKITKECLYLGIDELIVGKPLSNYSKVVQRHAEKNGFSVVRDLVGHGVGYAVHELPQIPNYGESVKGIVLKEGMTIALEPMINEGSFEVVLDDDGWTYKTRDGKLNGHFEHTVAVGKDGCEILTEI